MTIARYVTIAFGLVVLNSAVANPPTSENVKQRVSSLVEATLPDELSLLNVYVSNELVPASNDLAIDWVSAPKLGKQSIRVTQKGQTAWATVDIGRLQLAAVLAHDVPAGHVLVDADFQVTSLAARDVLDPKVVVGLTAGSDLPAGRPLSRHDVVFPAPLARGSSVTVLIRHGQVRLATQATLELPCRIGDLASVRLTSGKLFKGVLGPNQTIKWELKQ